METKHTAEPWNANYSAAADQWTVDAGSFCVADCGTGMGADANAKRIVACVNACTRIANPENMPENLNELGTRFVRARDERDALRAENKRLREALAGCVKQCADYENMPEDCAAAFRKARAALNQEGKP